MAAPVPQGVRTEFGSRGLLTRADLAKVKFEPASRKDRFNWLRDKGDASGKEFAKAAIAVHLPWHTFREGEDVPAYFVFKNGSDRDLPLAGRLDLYGPNPSTRNACAIGVYEAKTDKTVPVVGQERWGESELVVPANGFYCVRYDVGHTANGNPLPPGEYEVEWVCSGLHSAHAKFTITQRDDGMEPVAVEKRERVHFFRLTPERDRERYAGESRRAVLLGGLPLRPRLRGGHARRAGGRARWGVRPRPARHPRFRPARAGVG